MVRVSLLSVYGLSISYHIHEKVISYTVPKSNLVGWVCNEFNQKVVVPHRLIKGKALTITKA